MHLFKTADRDIYLLYQQAIWYKMDKPRIVGKFSFRNSRDPGDRDNDPTEINFIASEVNVIQLDPYNSDFVERLCLTL